MARLFVESIFGFYRRRARRDGSWAASAVLSPSCSASARAYGFNLHAGVRIEAGDDLGRERLCRYRGAPAVLCLVVRDAFASAERVERCGETLLFVFGKRVIGALDDVLAGGQAAQLRRKVGAVPVDDGHKAPISRVERCRPMR